MTNLIGKILILMSFAILHSATVPSPPNIPEIQAVGNHESIIIVWDNLAESSIDSLTGYSDFEGYRLYRSKDGGETWGKSIDRVWDNSGNHVAWRPAAQFDLISSSDSLHCSYDNGYLDGVNELCNSKGTSSIRGKDISGYDPFANWINLGESDGIERVFVDTDVLDGVEYTYAVTAYDMGMTSFNIKHNIMYNNINTASSTSVPPEEDCDRIVSSTNPAPYYNEYQCASMAHCFWDETSCVYSADPYCNKDDSYCDCTNGTALCTASVTATREACINPEFAGVWTTVKYSNKVSCESVHGNSQPGIGLGIDNPDGISGQSCNLLINSFGFSCADDFGGTSIAEACPVTCGMTIVDCDTLIVLDLAGEATGLSDVIISTSSGVETFTYFDAATVNDACSMDSSKSISITSSGTVLYKTDIPILGFQFNVVGTNVDTAYGGNSGEANFMTSSGYTWKTIYFSSDTTWSSNNPSHFPGYKYKVLTEERWGYPSFESPRLYESLTDYNSNGRWDDAEQFIDKNFSGVWDLYCKYEYCSNTAITNKTICENSGWDWFESEYPGVDTAIRCSDLGGEWLYEPYFDTNSNGIRNDAEPFTDENNNGIWDKRINPKNVITLTAGYKASNITYPADNTEEEFLSPDSTNLGNGSNLYNIVNEDDLEDVTLRFEINAGMDPDSFGDSTGSFATLNPALYCFEIISQTNQDPKETIEIEFTSLDKDSLIGLPGASYNLIDTLSNGSPQKIIIPKYQIENYKLTYVDDPLYESHWTEWFNGIQFRFDNGPNSFYGNPLSLVELKDVTYSPSSMSNLVHIKMRYKNQVHLKKRPSFRYKIEFSNSILDTAVHGTGRDCNQYTGYPQNSHTFLPFKITNITSGNKVKLYHLDKGVDYGSIVFGELGSGGACVPVCSPNYECINGSCVLKKGDDNCQWEYNEFFDMEDYVYSTTSSDSTAADPTNPDGYNETLFSIKIGFNWPAYAISQKSDYFGEVFWTTGWTWKADKSYATYDVVFHEGMLYSATETISASNPPDGWFDNNGDSINDNPWQMLYPWQVGDSIIVEPYRWYQDGDSWVADLSVIGDLDEDSTDDLEDISVVPNPYILNSNYFNESPGNFLMRFTRLPKICTITIYTITGEFVARINHNHPFDGNEWWNLKNGHGQEVAPGLYIYAVETPSGNKKIDKFAVVR